MNASHGSTAGPPQELKLTRWASPHPLGRGGEPEAAVVESNPSPSSATCPNNDPRVIEALETYLEAMRSGQPWSREEFLARHAEIAGPLDQCLSGLEFVQAASVQLEESESNRAAARAEPVPYRTQLGDYRVLREVGRGGMGVVYEAEQVSLGRRVALKVLPFAAAIDPKQRQRFQIEAQAAAQLHHPHIVPIFGVGCDHGIHYYAMQYVEGRSLAAIIHELRGVASPDPGSEERSAMGESISTEEATHHPASEPGAGPRPGGPIPAELGTSATDPVSGGVVGVWTGVVAEQAGGEGTSLPSTHIGLVHRDRAFCRSVARLGVEAADALDHAHGLGILHRDIKPANLLIDEQGAVWITDFGLARFHSDRSLTGTGDVVGTLRYMSPEQALARRGVVDQRTDIYALGVTLYELLTLRPAFDGRDHHELLRQIAQEEPPRPRRLNPAVPRDFETIILKAMSKELSGRYGTAQELAADLRRFLDDRPILARRPGPLERTLRWARRRWELVATAAAIVMISLAISTTLIYAQAREKAKANDNYHKFITESFPLIDQNMMGVLVTVGRFYQNNEAAQREGMSTYEQAQRLYERASELLPTDAETRLIVGRARARLGYIHAAMSSAKGSNHQHEPELLGKALADYRRSTELLERLLEQSPGNPKFRRYLADTVGLFGLGCCLRFAHNDREAERFYRRAIQLRRELVRGAYAGPVGGQAPADLTGEAENLSLLVNTVHTLAGMLEEQGQGDEAEALRAQLDGDFGTVAARFAAPQFQSIRRIWAMNLVQSWFSQALQVLAVPSPSLAARRMMILNCRLALRLDSQHAYALNNLAWALTSVPSDPWFDPKEGLALAREAVRLDPTNWFFSNTLGVAAYRDRDWKSAAAALQDSIHFNGGAAVDCFFLAMTRWQQGDCKDALRWFNQAVAWIDRNKVQIERDPSFQAELRQFRAEAESLLDQARPESRIGSPSNPKRKKTTENAHQGKTPPDQDSNPRRHDSEDLGDRDPQPRDPFPDAVLMPGTCEYALRLDPLRLFRRG